MIVLTLQPGMILKHCQTWKNWKIKHSRNCWGTQYETKFETQHSLILKHIQVTKWTTSRIKHRKLELWNITLKHRFQWNITNPTYRNIKHFNLRLLNSTLTSSIMKAFDFQSSFDSCIFRLITSIHLDKSFCLFRDVIT